jgi:hypothetical protein
MTVNKNHIEDSIYANKVSPFVIVRLTATICIVFFVCLLPQLTVGTKNTQKRMDEVLLKYYTKNEINSQKIHYIETRNRLKLSNEVILPMKDYYYVHGDSLYHFSLLILVILIFF